MQTQKAWTGPIAGHWLGLDGCLVDSPVGAKGLQWEKSMVTEKRDQFLAKQGVEFLYATSSDGRIWRRETMSDGEPGFREIFATLEAQEKARQQMTLASLLQDLEDGKEYEFHPFWSSGPLSLQSSHPFEINSRTWPTAQHFVSGRLAQLTGNKQAFDRIMSKNDSAHAARMFLELLNVENPNKLNLWREKRYEVLVRCTFWKALKNEEALRYLLSTGKQILVATSKYNDTFGAGIGRDSSDLKFPQRWPGQNLLGFALMESRKKLRQHVAKQRGENYVYAA